MQNEIMKEDGSFNFASTKNKAPIEIAVDVLRFLATKKMVKEKFEELRNGKHSIH